jgi:hypothetical protein
MAGSDGTSNRWLVAGLVALVAAASFVVARVTVSAGAHSLVPGPRREIRGVTFGFARTRPGAEAAAAHSLLEIERAMDTLDARRLQTVARLVATPTEAGVMARRAADVIAVERTDGVPVRRVAISTEFVSYTSSSAAVTVVECWIYARASQMAVWAVETVSLVWAKDSWLVATITSSSARNESADQLKAQFEFPGPGDASVR